MLQDALGHSWRPLVRSWTLWDASESLQDALGGLKHYACSVFCGPGDATSPSKVANSTYPGPPKPYNFYMIASNIYWDWD